MRERIKSARIFARKVALSGYAIFGAILFGLDMFGRALGRDAIAMPWEIVVPVLIAVAGAEAYHQLRMENLELKSRHNVDTIKADVNSYRGLLERFTHPLSVMFFEYVKEHPDPRAHRWEFVADRAKMAGRGQDDPLLTEFASQVYRKGISASGWAFWARSPFRGKIKSFQFEGFHDRRRYISNHLSGWNAARFENPEVAEYLRSEVKPRHRRIAVMLSYLARPLAEALDHDLDLGSVGWYQLGVWWDMEDEKDLTQETETGHEIPVPKRREFLENLEKASEPDAEDEDDSDRSAGGEVEK